MKLSKQHSNEGLVSLNQQAVTREGLRLPACLIIMDGFGINNDAYGNAEDISVGDCFTISKLLCKAYLAGEADEIYLAYTRFDSVLSQTATAMQLLPLQAEAKWGASWYEAK